MRQHTHNTGHLGYDRNGRAKVTLLRTSALILQAPQIWDRMPSQIMRSPPAIPNRGGIWECSLQMEFTPSFDSVR